MKLWPMLLVGCGGFLGAIARYAVATVAARRLGPAWPWGTFFINVTGCFVIGLFLTAASLRAFAEEWRYLVPIGFVGAYTTFSTYGYETVRLVEEGMWGRAALYVALSNAVGIAAVLAGIWLARRL